MWKCIKLKDNNKKKNTGKTWQVLPGKNLPISNTNEIKDEYFNLPLYFLSILFINHFLVILIVISKIFQ